MEYLKKNLFSMLTAAPIGLLAVGAFIINIALSKYGILDFPLLNSRTIYVGFMAVFVIGAYLVLWFTYVSVTGAKAEILVILLNLFWKPLMVSPVIWSFLLSKDDGFEIRLLSLTVNSRILLAPSLFMIVAFSCFFVVGREYIVNGITKDKLGKLTFWGGTVATLIGAIPTIVLILAIERYRSVFLTLLYISFVLFFQTAMLWASRNDRSRGIDTRPTSLFSNDRKITKMDLVYIGFWVLLVAIISISSYARNIYPNIPTNLGGGQYGYNSVSLSDNLTMDGTIVHSNNDYLYMVDDGNNLHQIKQSSVTAYTKRVITLNAQTRHILLNEGPPNKSLELSP